MGNRGRPRGTREPPARPAPTTRAERRRLARKVRRRRRTSLAREVPLLALLALAIALVLKTFLVQAFVIPSGSMEQTVRIGDRVLVDKLTPWFGSEPHRGDVVVFKDPGGWLSGEPAPAPAPVVVKQLKQAFAFIGLLPASGEQDLIKRVVGVGGDTVVCCDREGRLTVNGEPLDEPYLYPGNPPSQIRFTVHVPKGHLWVMGDHRSDSADSRFHMGQLLDGEHTDGTVPESLVVGRAFAVAWPLGHWQRLREPPAYSSVPPPGAAGATGPGGTASTAMVGSVGPSAGAGATVGGQRTDQLPTPGELPLVMGMVGLRRSRRGRGNRLRSGCGGPSGRRTVRFRRAREGGGLGAPRGRDSDRWHGPRRGRRRGPVPECGRRLRVSAGVRRGVRPGRDRVLRPDG
ncbi:signal peptidase I [Actinacidiphila yeochonensis]|uniref:signal peptidase I n=1 Tax=Actinacidiphila yeochonensis TaxID=89050 RepID=UPI00099C98C7|nr:signal peptidase I [Actinacidiphila yeochonensis]